MATGNYYERALALLESPAQYPALPKRERSFVQLRVWRYPSFHPCSSWAVVRAGKNLFLRRVTWDQRHPPTPDPVTYGSEISLDATAYEAVLASLREVQLPPFITVSTIGLDGTRFGVELGGFGPSARLSWWETPPPEWSQLREWHAQTVAQFDGLLPASTPSLGPG
jgi:hypothetical protein